MKQFLAVAVVLTVAFFTVSSADAFFVDPYTVVVAPAPVVVTPSFSRLSFPWLRRSSR